MADQTASSRAIPPEVPPDLRAEMERLQSPHRRERGHAAYRIGQMGPRAAAAAPYLVDLLSDRTDVVLQVSPSRSAALCEPSPGEQAEEALLKIGPGAVEALAAALEHGDAFVRRRAAWALGKLGDRRAIEPLVGVVLEHENSNARAEAMAILAVLGDRSLWESPRDRDGAEEQLADTRASRRRSRDSQIVHRLITSLNDKCPEIRARAAGALGWLGDGRAVDPLIAALQCKGPWVRRVKVAIGSIPETNVQEAAARALGELGDRRAVEPLIAALKNGAIRKAAISALGSIKDRRAVEPVIAYLKHPFQDLRSCAAETLGKLGDRRAVVPLQAMLDDRFFQVRQAAADALRTITRESREPG